MQRGISPPSDEAGPISGSSAASMAAQGLVSQDPDDGMNDMNDGRKAKRELSQSKRAAQNRAAQRAFRQRKEHYIKKLEQQVREYGEMEHNFKALQNDHHALREYVIQLQSRLLDMSVEPPQPPPNVNINPPTAVGTAARGAHHAGAAHLHAPAPAPAPTVAPEQSGPSATAAGTLADVAAAVAGLRARESAADALYAKPSYKSEPSYKPDTPYKSDHAEESQTADEIRRQLQQEGGLPPPSSLRT